MLTTRILRHSDLAVAPITIILILLLPLDASSQERRDDFYYLTHVD